MIRKVTDEDIPQLQKVIIASLWTNTNDYSDKQLQNLENKFSQEILLDRSHKYDIFVYDKPPIIGTVTFKLETSELKGMFVHPDFQKQGIGQELVNFLCDYARQRKVTALRLASSIPAVSFYQKRGFVQTGQVHDDDQYGNSVVMSKQL